METNDTITSVNGFPNATIHEENGEIHVDLGNGLGEGVYPLHRLDDRRGNKRPTRIIQ